MLLQNFIAHCTGPEMNYKTSFMYPKTKPLVCNCKLSIMNLDEIHDRKTKMLLVACSETYNEPITTKSKLKNDVFKRKKQFTFERVLNQIINHSLLQWSTND